MNSRKINFVISCFIFGCIAFNSLWSQNFTQIPDTQFQLFLSSEYPSADTIIGGDFYIDGDNLDVINDTSIILVGSSGFLVQDLSGIEVFISLKILNLNNNNVSNLPSIPATVEYLNLYGNNLLTLPELPPTLKTLITTSNTQLNSLPILPSSLEVLTCVQNNLSALPVLPVNLKELNCGNNNITTLPILPSGLIKLSCLSNPLTSLPAIPSSIRELDFQNCSVSIFPSLPNEIHLVQCSGNGIVALPTLPDSLNIFYCSSNQITEIPAIPEQLVFFGCANNQINCLPVLPQSIAFLNISNNPITCLPNYLPSMTVELSLPLCSNFDPINNPNNCEQASGIIGLVFKDSSNNCSDKLWTLPNVPLRLEDFQGDFLEASQTTYIGSYMFVTSPEDYVVKIDTSALPNSVVVNCPSVNNYNVTTSTSSPISSDNDFGLQCDGFDISAIGGIPVGLVFPGETHDLKILAGDLSNFADMHCANGVSGEIEIVISGLTDTISFSGSPTIINDSTVSYWIADFGAQILDTIVFNIRIDTTATVTDTIRVFMRVSTMDVGDIDTSNDTTWFKYPCINSYDPNMKVVTPGDVPEGYEDPFTYTIYFQNTGSAPALNIRLEDVMDDNLDLESFRFINASHNQYYTINNTSRKLTIIYPDIHLPDSSSNPMGSIGYFHYKIKPKQNLIAGTMIENTAYIYFDYNAAIVTNTAENVFYSTASLNELTDDLIKVFPNPTKDIIHINTNNSIFDLKIYSLDGKLMYTSTKNESDTQVIVQDFPNGMYLLNILSPEFNKTVRLIKSN